MCGNWNEMKPPSPEVWELRKKKQQDEEKLKCPKCGISFTGISLYCCQNNDCPIQTKITC